MKGHLHLICAPRQDASGESYLRAQSFRAPFHLSKPHSDAGALVVNIVNPTAGIFDDDQLELDATTESGAHLVLTTPSSNRIYKSRNGNYAALKQKLCVESGAIAEFFPEPFIPHAGARYRQYNEIKVEPGGVLLYFEWLSPGRVAKGEVFEYEELCWDTDLWLGRQLIARERYALRPSDHSVASLRWFSPQAHYLGCFLTGLAEIPQDEIERLAGECVYVGFGPLSASGCWVIKALCSEALVARKTIRELRRVLYEAMGKRAAALGRV